MTRLCAAFSKHLVFYDAGFLNVFIVDETSL
jgi:hypothetical protein